MADPFNELSDVRPVCVPGDKCDYRYRKEPPFKLTFIAQWYMKDAELEKRFLLNYYHYDGSIELKDINRNATFLKRMKVDNIGLSDLFLGNKLLVLNRHIVILQYCDEPTRQFCQPKEERAFLLVRPLSVEHLPDIVNRLEKCFRIIRAKKAVMTENVAKEFSKKYLHTDKYLKMVDSLKFKQVVAFLVMAENANEKLRNMVGNVEKETAQDYKSLRGLYGKSSDDEKGFYMSDSTEAVLKDASFFFAECPACTLPCYSIMDGTTTCCVIKPHAYKEGRVGPILKDIECNGFKIGAFGVYWLNNTQAEEFYEIYKMIYTEKEFYEMVDQLSVGPCVVAELYSDTNCEDTQERFRTLVGPADPDLARKVRPTTLRAIHGLDKIANGLHCTDLPEDTIPELQFFFDLLDRQNRGISSVTK